MPSLRETLELIITGNATGAVKAFEEVGAAAEKDLGKAEGSMTRVGGRMQMMGAGMVVVGAIALDVLHHFAGAAEEAELSNLKLENSIEHSGSVTKDSAGAFKDLAEKLQQTTEFSHVATQNMEAYLIQVGLTKDQVLRLTPAVQDLAAKTGIDLNDAAKKVVMALNGKKKGLEALLGPLDAAKYATDRYAAVTDALGRVQGFAETQGKTFDGQLTILGNNLKQLEEGVGVGVVKAFQQMFDAIGSVTGALDSLSPGAQSAIGQWATYGATGLVVVGVFNIVAGTLLKAAAHLGIHTAAVVVDTVAVEANTVALEEEAAASTLSLGAIGLLAVGVAALGYAMYQGITAGSDLTINIKGIAKATDDELSRSIKDFTTIASAAAGGMEAFGRKMADESIPTAQRYADALDRNGISSVEFRKGIAGATQAEIENQAATDGLTVAQEQQKLSSKELAAALKDLHDALHATVDPFFAMVKAADDNVKALDAVTKASTGVWYATVAAADAHRQYGDNSAQAAAADVTLSDAKMALSAATLAAGQSALSENDAMNVLNDAMKNQGLTVDDAKATLAAWVAQGMITQAIADQIAASFAGVAGQAAAITTNAIAAANALNHIGGLPSAGGAGGSKVYAAAGYEGWINKPTPFIIGEGGEPEYVSVTPRSKMGSTSSSGTQTAQTSSSGVEHIHVHINDVEVATALRRYNRRLS